MSLEAAEFTNFVHGDIRQVVRDQLHRERCERRGSLAAADEEHVRCGRVARHSRSMLEGRGAARAIDTFLMGSSKLAAPGVTQGY